MKAASDNTIHHNRMLKRATLASVLVALFLIGLKAVAWHLSDAVSLLASLVDSSMDALVSLVNLLAVRYALQPADNEHRFGHGKAESLAGLGQSLFIAASAAYLAIESMNRVIQPEPVRQVGVAVAVMLISIGVTFALFLYQRSVIKATGSVAIKADSLHYLSDLLTNLGVIVALILTALGWRYGDALIALAISVYIFQTAFRLWLESIQLLLDRELPEVEQRRIEGLALEHPEVLGVHQLRTRKSGSTRIIQMHLVLDANMPLWRANGVSHDVEISIRRAFPGCDVLIHQDPFHSRKQEPEDPIS